jgi:hypothetical protein
MQVKAPPLSKERRVGLDMAEAKRLLDVIDGEWLKALYVLALTTGATARQDRSSGLRRSPVLRNRFASR